MLVSNPIVGLNLVPLATGLSAAFTGAALFVSEGPISADFDAQIRVYDIWFTTIFFLSFWMAFNVETCGPILKIVFSPGLFAGTVISAGSAAMNTPAAVLRMLPVTDAGIGSGHLPPMDSPAAPSGSR